MDKRFELTVLMDFYAPLLTEHRRQVLALRLEEDLTFQEIADQMGISRQGVHDALKAAEAQLLKYEEMLGLVRRYRAMEKAVTACRECLDRLKPAPGSEEALAQARASLELIERIER